MDDCASLTSPDILERAGRLRSYALCDSCLGRQFAQVAHGLENRRRGQCIREGLGTAPVDPGDCWLCEGLMGELEELADLVVEALEPYQYATFLVGSRVEEALELREGEVAAIGGDGEPIKREINREVGKRVEEHTGKTVDFSRPDVTAIVNTQYNHVELDVRPLYIYGRYCKHVRGIPQTKWWCRKCRGVGCDYCGGEGKMYEESVEELVAAPVVEATGGSEESFHGAGREDIDVRMLGHGRPFVLEVKEPRRRFVDLESLEKAINRWAEGKVTVSRLRFADRAEIEHLKAARWTKTYRAVVSGCERGKLNEAVNALRGCYINQRTPSRVVHRRADKVRRRRVLDIHVEDTAGDTATLVIRAESGTYIKELVTGDGGRTAPSLQALTGCPLHMQNLDVIAIGDEDGQEIERNKEQDPSDT